MLKGLDKLQRRLDDLQNNIKQLDGTHTVPMLEVLTPDFISKHTKFKSAQELFGASGFKVETQEDFKAIPDEEFDVFIRSISSFQDWKAMLGEAARCWTSKKLGF